MATMGLKEALSRAPANGREIRKYVVEVYRLLGDLQDALSEFREAAEAVADRDAGPLGGLVAAVIRRQGRVRMALAAAEVAEAAVEMSAVADEAVTAADRVLSVEWARALETARERPVSALHAVARGLSADPGLASAFAAFSELAASCGAEGAEPDAEPEPDAERRG